ncbi:uroporphyrinogen decarboxylase family protein [Chloroflexota bacterium]
MLTMVGQVAREKYYQEKEKTLREEIERKTGKSPEELYEEREARVRDAIELKEPDRVPVAMGGGYFAARYTDLSPAAVYYDPVVYREAVKKTILDFEPDLFQGGVAGANSGLALEFLDAKQTRWPGGTLPPGTTHQFVEGEYMKEDEYDYFLSDPSDFNMRVYLPRVFGILGSFSKLPPLRSFISGNAFMPVVNLFAREEFIQLAEALHKAGQEQEKFREAMSGFQEEMAALGFPPNYHSGGTGGAPFDAVSDNLRGMRGTMIDMFRQPEKLLAAIDLILQMRISDRAIPANPEQRGNPKRVFMALHRGAEGFMSKKDFETFYWPGLKKSILRSIELGYVPIPFFEGSYQDRLEYLLELPKGKVVCHFEHMDMARAKDVLGDHLCIMGNVPSSILQVGSTQDVEEYCENLIKVCGKGGGFILTNGSSIDEARPDNVKAMVDSVKKYSPA